MAVSCASYLLPLPRHSCLSENYSPLSFFHSFLLPFLFKFIGMSIGDKKEKKKKVVCPCTEVNVKNQICTVCFQLSLH